MKAIRYIVAVFGFLLVWVFVAAIVKVMVIHFISPRNGAFMMPGNSWTWRDVPGMVLGIFAGILTFRASVREPREGTHNVMRWFVGALGLFALILAAFVGYFLYTNL